MTRPVRVVKVGGSLLSCEDLPRRLKDWLAPAATTEPSPRSIDILIAGGGTLVDQVRQLDQRFALGAETSHWMSVGAMTCTARLLAALVQAGPPVCRWEELQPLIAGGTTPLVFEVQEWLEKHEAGQEGLRLTHNWQSTSDAIAGRLAQVLAAELVLLKSTDLAPGTDWETAASQGLVDEHFPRIAAQLSRVAWVNLRAAPPAAPPIERIE